MKHFLTTEHWSQNDLQQMIDFAKELKEEKFQPLLKNKSVALLFFNPSLRTRTSFELGVHQLGGQAIVLQPGKDAWPIEFELGSIMDGEAEEHIQEVAQVLSAYCDIIAVRAFPKFQNWQDDRQDKLIKSLAQFSTVPVINMETITHPCQELAHIMALQENLGDLKGKKYVLTWTYHPKPLNTAVANSSLMIASKFGMDVTLLCPNEDYLLDQHYMDLGQTYSSQHGNQLTVSHDIDSAYEGADVVYAKSWGALPYFGQWEKEKPMRDQYKHFMVDEAKMAKTNNALFSHCLPMRRNVKATDGVVDSKNCIAIQEAENRLHVQKSMMNTLINHS
ncbi:N-acetylornithine carbamoyltransferase [Kangiella geojedonensis]|uniref:N-acetylornithine carbamoyltransferase n=1 Tax=Kangiella geojedonensis TaxID=914150 RepID=A0A0F6TSF0_9GAMM|nr:N-acetylornithine carbamoyltransferase [Kangiella geojedonensis]AKE52775.1 Aspartate/ornithine carbamoyltransferase carbamoyl-P binding domain protein [Kangiella geojedonensis]